MKETIRERAFSAKNLRTKRVTISMGGEPTEIEIRQPSVKVRSVILETGRFENGKPTNITAAEESKALAIIRCCYDPESGESIFNDRDREMLLGPNCAGWFDTLAGECAAILRAQDDAVEVLEKNSEATPSAS